MNKSKDYAEKANHLRSSSREFRDEWTATFLIIDILISILYEMEQNHENQ